MSTVVSVCVQVKVQISTQCLLFMVNTFLAVFVSAAFCLFVGGGSRVCACFLFVTCSKLS